MEQRKNTEEFSHRDALSAGDLVWQQTKYYIPRKLIP
jgi:hypothetical protein